jgi:cysteine-rich repeat protein
MTHKSQFFVFIVSLFIAGFFLLSKPESAFSQACCDGAVDLGEECDDGNASNEDACTNSCLFNICGDGFVNLGIEECDDGNTTSGDGCSATCLLEGEAGNCADAIDNDGDGLTDCDDSDCAGDPACAPAEVEDCSDGIDNDGDGLTDCDDSDCAGDPACAPAEVEDCSDGIDNDGDGLVDCDDPNCSEDSACRPRPAPIPTIGQWGMIIMAGMLGLFSIIVLVGNRRSGVAKLSS